LTLLDRVGLLSDKDKIVEGFSKGMKMRLNFIRSIMHNPTLILSVMSGDQIIRTYSTALGKNDTTPEEELYQGVSPPLRISIIQIYLINLIKIYIIIRITQTRKMIKDVLLERLAPP